MSVQNLVLGQLCRRRGYGYELIDRLHAVMEPLKVTEAAIYRALMSLHTKGLIVEIGRETAIERGTPRVIFDATAEGRRHFDRWMASEPRKAALREELHLQLLVADDAHIPDLIEMLERYGTSCREGLALALGRMNEIDVDDPRNSPFGAPLVLDAACSHLQAMIEWSERTRLALVNRVDGTGMRGRSRP